jgi:hypothetical protein
MKTDFKVLEWLRQVREQYAGETSGLSDADRLARLRQETQAWILDLPRKRSQPAARMPTPAWVGEGRTSYGPSGRHGNDNDKHA